MFCLCLYYDLYVQNSEDILLEFDRKDTSSNPVLGWKISFVRNT